MPSILPSQQPPWLNMVFLAFERFSTFWASLVVVALVGMSGKRECVGFIGFGTSCQFLGWLGECGSCPLWFLRGAKHLEYHFSLGETPSNGTQPGRLLDNFLTLRTSSYFFHLHCHPFPPCPFPGLLFAFSFLPARPDGGISI